MNLYQKRKTNDDIGAIVQPAKVDAISKAKAEEMGIKNCGDYCFVFSITSSDIDCDMLEDISNCDDHCDLVNNYSSDTSISVHDDNLNLENEFESEKLTSK